MSASRKKNRVVHTRGGKCAAKGVGRLAIGGATGAVTELTLRANATQTSLLTPARFNCDGPPLSGLAKPSQHQPGERTIMKRLSVVVAGTGQIRDVEIQPGTTAGDILNQLGLKDYLLSKGPNDPFFAAAESVYDKVGDGEKIFASTKAEVGEVELCA